MSSRPFRRSSLISPFGPGAMSVAPDGTSTITAGLDHWFTPPLGSNPMNYDFSEFKFHEWRLERELGVDHFRLPPDFRKRPSGFGTSATQATNLGLHVPMLRFPRWHVCPNLACQSLDEAQLSELPTPRCTACKRDPSLRGRPMIQVQFVAICEAGHVQDFPWKEWVHRSSKPECNGRLHMYSTSGGTLGARRVICECGKSRDLEGILGGIEGNAAHDPGSEPGLRLTPLSRRLDASGEPYLCRGHRPWLGDDLGIGCGKSLQGTLRGATNVYFSNVQSSVYLPVHDESPARNLMEAVDRAGIVDDVRAFRDAVPEATLVQLRTFIGRKLPTATERELSDDAIADLIGFLDGDSPSTLHVELGVEPPATRFRRPEFAILRNDFNSSDLLVRSVPVDRYKTSISKLFSRVQLIPRLRETRAFAGFSRINPVALDNESRTLQLWRQGATKEADWLPAYIVYGEGIYLELDASRLSEWESQAFVRKRIGKLATRSLAFQEGEAGGVSRITPRFVLMHTLAHILINQLVFDCGYSSAALRERLYVSSDPAGPMAGLLIYTASGDSEGTMGGLVRMGTHGLLEDVVSRAIARARWCSGDPVCMELGESGQGPGSCNLAACHSCALLPETSCEEFNRFLDRWTVVGEPETPLLGFFSSLTDESQAGAL